MSINPFRPRPKSPSHVISRTEAQQAGYSPALPHMRTHNYGVAPIVTGRQSRVINNNRVSKTPTLPHHLRQACPVDVIESHQSVLGSARGDDRISNALGHFPTKVPHGYKTCGLEDKQEFWVNKEGHAMSSHQPCRRAGAPDPLTNDLF